MLKPICSTLTGENLNVDKIHFLDLLVQRWRKKQNDEHHMCLPQRAVKQITEWCCGLNRWGCGETHVGVKVWVERSQDLHFLFSLCVLHAGHHPACNTTSCFCLRAGVSGYKYWAWDCVHTHERHPRICVSGCLRVCVHSVYSGGRGIAFTAHHLHFHTQFVMSVTRHGESWGSRHKKMAASTLQMGEEQGQWLGKGGSGVAPWP